MYRQALLVSQGAEIALKLDPILDLECRQKKNYLLEQRFPAKNNYSQIDYGTIRILFVLFKTVV